MKTRRLNTTSVLTSLSFVEDESMKDLCDVLLLYAVMAIVSHSRFSGARKVKGGEEEIC